jgi:hypothetical protein
VELRKDEGTFNHFCVNPYCIKDEGGVNHLCIDPYCMNEGGVKEG